MGSKQASKQAKKAAKEAKAAKQAPARKIPQSSPPSGSQRHRPEPRERDETYDLVSLLYHALQGAEACGTYMSDAETAGDDDLAEFFEED